MRVRHIVLALVAVCSLGGIGLSIGLARGFDALDRAHAALRNQTQSRSEVTRLADATAQWLATSDLVLGSGQDLLLADALRQSDNLMVLAEQVKGLVLSEVSRGRLEALIGQVKRAAEVLAAAQQVPDEHRSAELTALLVEFDQITAPLPALVSELDDETRATAAREGARVAERRQQLVAFGAAALGLYLLVVLATWFWVSRVVTRPIADLMREAIRARRSGGRLDLVPRGPLEIRQLTESIDSFAERIQAANEIMEQTIAERTAELLHSNRVKDEFLARMSHEIRTPLNGMLGAIDLLEPSAADERQREWIGMGRRSGAALLQLVEQILDYSNLQAGRTQFDSSGFDLAKVVESVVQAAAADAATKGVSIEFEISPELPPRLIGDGDRVRQALSNLVDNAVKFTTQGSVWVAVDGWPTDAAEWDVEIRVEDTGVGMAADQIAEVFEPFRQADSGASRGFEGPGLGLAIARELVEGMGGRLRAASRLGSGSIFWIALRLAAAPPEAEASGEVGASLRDARVLVVEDNPVNQAVLRAMLESLGCRAECVESGVLAIDRIQREDFDLVLMDCHMPGLDGYQTTRRIRAAGIGIPILACTASVERERCRDAGMDEMLSKPVDLPTLRRTLSSWLGRTRRAPR